MNLLKTDKHLLNGVLIANKFRYKLINRVNTRTLITIRNDLNQNQNIFALKKFNVFCNEHNFCLKKQNNIFNNWITIRCFSKGKDRPKDKRKGDKPKVVLTDEEINELVPINELKIELNNVTQRLKDSLIANVSVRSNTQSIDNLVIEMNGTKYCIKEVANITRKSPQLVVLNLSSMPDALKPILTAISESGMNLSPQQEGTVIYLPIPKVTREHREGLAHNAKTLCQKAKEELKHINSSFSNYTKKQKKANVSEELIFNVNENVKYLIDSKLHECDVLLEQKLKELLQ